MVIRPGTALRVGGEDPVTVSIVNKSDQKLAFKFRTTGADDVQPKVAYGILPPDGAKTTFEVDYKAAANPRSFNDKDHLTILVVVEVPENVTVSCFFFHGWGSSRVLGDLHTEPLVTLLSLFSPRPNSGARKDANSMGCKGSSCPLKPPQSLESKASTQSAVETSTTEGTGTTEAEDEEESEEESETEDE